MKLEYKAVSRDSKLLKGILEAKDINEGVSYLREKGLLPIKITEKKDKGIGNLFPFFKKTKSSDIAFFTQQLSSMLSSGLTLLQSLSILKSQVQNTSMRSILQNVIADIEDGKAFSEALSKFPDVFSPVYISLIKASESAGLLDKVLARLSVNLEKQEKLKSTVKSALMYPIIVVFGMIIVVVVMMVFIIPQLSTMYQSLNIELPLPTRIIVGLSNFFIVFWPFIIGGIIFSIFLLKRWKKTASGELIIDSFLLKIPVFGNLRKKMILTEVSRTLGLLVGSGELVIDALKQTADVSGSVHYKNAILNVTGRVEKGLSVGDSVMLAYLFPPIFVEMVRIGEETGKLDESLLKVSEYFENEVDTAVKGLTAALEPLIIVALGIGIAFLMISIITPIYNLTSQIK